MAAIGLAVLAVTSALPRMQLAGSLIGLPLAGFGVALAAVALTREAGSEVPIADKGIAYGVFQTATYLGGCIAVAGLTTIVEAEGRSIAGLSGGYRISFLVAAGVALLSAVAVAGILAPDRRLRRPHVD
jgi:hypothetical protein